VDNRIKFPPTTVDFSAVGTTGQDHDNYPAPGSQARYDHQRMVIIGLLSNQSSTSAPTEFREGTLWFDLNDFSIKIYSDQGFRHLAETIAVSTVDEEDNNTSSILSLAEWYERASGILASSAPEITFSGLSENDVVTTIPIPDSLRDQLFSDSRPFVYKNGILLDPRLTTLEPGSNPNAINIDSNDALGNGDRFTVLIKRIPNDQFYITDVVV